MTNGQHHIYIYMIYIYIIYIYTYIWCMLASCMLAGHIRHLFSQRMSYTPRRDTYDYGQREIRDIPHYTAMPHQNHPFYFGFVWRAILCSASAPEDEANWLILSRGVAHVMTTSQVPFQKILKVVWAYMHIPGHFQTLRASESVSLTGAARLSVQLVMQEEITFDSLLVILIICLGNQVLAALHSSFSLIQFSQDQVPQRVCSST